MKNLFPRLLIVAAFASYATLADAQAVPRGSGGGSSSSSSGSSSSGGGGGSTSSGSSGGSSSYSPPPSPPSHSAAPRTPSHSGYSGGRTRNGGSGNGSYSGAGTRTTSGIRHPENGSAATAPTYARPDGRPIVGYAVPRTNYRPPPVNGGTPIIVYPWGWGYGLGAFGYGWGLGYMCDPYSFYGSCGYPYGGYGYGYPGMGYYGGYPGGYDYYGGGNYSTYDYSEETEEALSGQLRVKVKPREARVIVDGNFMGTVDDFDGMFQKLTLPQGRHQIMLQLEGYEPLTFSVNVIAGETVDYDGRMQKVGELPKH